MMINDLIKVLTECKERHGEDIEIFSEDSSASHVTLVLRVRKKVQESTNVIEFKREEKRK